MNASGERWRQLNRASGKTATAVEQQIAAMGSEVLEVGLYDPDAGGGESVMIPRVWDSGTIAKSVPWLRHQNREGRNIYIRPKGEHDLSMVDDLTADAISAMKQTGFNPAVIVETSPDNFQAWLKHNGRLSKEVSTAAARALAEKFGGDRGAADWRHFGRLAGFTNRKAKHLDASTGLYPYVRLIEATGGIYPEAERFLADVKSDLERQQAKRGHWRSGQLGHAGAMRPQETKNIDGFREDGRYGGDGTRVDLAYAVYALSHGADTEQVANAIRSRDLSHKGNERRQDDYVARTIKKALGTIERGR
jgi:DNA primase RepB-like protein